MPPVINLPLTNKARLPTMLLWLGAALIVFFFFWVLEDIVQKGWSRISWHFLTGLPEDAGRSGGIAPILVSTGGIMAVCLGVAVPTGVGAALFLAEFSGHETRLGRLIRHGLDLLAGVPSIVFGLFGNAVFCVLFGFGFSILSGGLTLACMVLPLLIRTIEVGLRSLPVETRLAAAALGLSRLATIRRVLLPAAAPVLLVGLLLAGSRAIAETAALVFTSGYVDRMPSSVFDSGRAVSVHIFDLSMNIPGGDQSAYASALVLIALLTMTSGLTALIGRRWRNQRIIMK
ncbi:MAG: phosphate ABC transporter permease PstA [Nitrospiria bacterium]